MQVQVIRYMKTGDDEIETWDYQPQVVVGKYLQRFKHSGPWVLSVTMCSCSWLES